VIPVCKALKAHGVKGDIKVECFTDTPSVLKDIKVFYIDGKEYIAESVKPFGNFALIKIKDIKDMTAAETFRNKLFYANRADMPAPETGSYYIDDLIGCVVSDETDTKIGTVVDILQYGSADIFVLRENGKTIMFPHLKSVIISVKPTEKTLTVNKAEFIKVAVYED